MKNKPISAKCITYGRVEFLEESIESFLRQQYEGESELVIVNDYPLQTLKFDHPKVRIINLDKTFSTIGDKENFAVSQCRYDTIAVWDDDDLALPNHLSNINKYFIEDSDLLHWKGVYFNVPNITSITNLGNSGIVYSRKIWEQIGGHPIENAGYDMSFVINIKNNSNKIVNANPPDSEVSWFYVWGGRGFHMSGAGTDTIDRPNILQRHGSYIEEQRKLGKIPTGEVLLNPHWKQDYIKLLKDYVS